MSPCTTHQMWACAPRKAGSVTRLRSHGCTSDPAACSVVVEAVCQLLCWPVPAPFAIRLTCACPVGVLLWSVLCCLGNRRMDAAAKQFAAGGRMWYAPGVQLSRRGGVRVVAVLLFGKSFLASKGRTPKIDQHSALCCGMTLGPVGSSARLCLWCLLCNTCSFVCLFPWQNNM